VICLYAYIALYSIIHLVDNTDLVVISFDS